VDDILIVYKDNIIDIEEVLSSFNNITPGLIFTLEREQDDKLNFLDLTIMKGANNLTYEIFKKPTPLYQTIRAILWNINWQLSGIL
jgi:hypothetical protein